MADGKGARGPRTEPPGVPSRVFTRRETLLRTHQARPAGNGQDARYPDSELNDEE